MKRTAIIAAMAGEVKPFLTALAKEGWRHERHGTVHLWHLKWAEPEDEWIIAFAGAGQQAATRAVAAAEQSGPLHAMLSVGWVGALDEAFAPGKAYRIAGVIDQQTGERFEAQKGQEKIWLVTGPCVADDAAKQRLAAAYKAQLVDMEAAAVARLAAMRGIPFYGIKGVSDGFQDKLPDFNRFIGLKGEFQLSRLILFVLPRPWLWPALLRMGENSKKASQAIAAEVLQLLRERV